VPLSQAADASGLLTTAVQLGQVIGVAVFGTVFLSLKQQSPLIVSEQSHMSAAATSTTTYSLAVLAVIGLVAALALSRTVRSASETTARAGGR
jgi:cytochrome b561